MKRYLLKLAALALLSMSLFAVGVSPSTAKAAHLVEKPPVGPNQCELTQLGGGGGNIPLDSSYAPDEGLRETLQGYTDKATGQGIPGYNLLCSSDIKPSKYTLVNPDPIYHLAGTTTVNLYLENLIQAPNDSSYLHDGLQNGNVTLNCQMLTS